MRETTALGAAIAAGMAVGLWDTFEDLQSVNNQDKAVFKPQITPEEAAQKFTRWEKAVNMSRGWFN